MLNPFSIFFIIILGILLTYSLSWSTFNEPLTVPMMLFLTFILITLLLFSKIFNRTFPEGTFVKRSFRINLIPWTLLAILSMAAEFVYEKAIPIIEILVLKSGYEYTSFGGIPGFHVFAVTFVSFLGLYCWQLFLEEKRWYLLLLSVLFVSFPIMLFNRGGFIMNLSSMFFIFLLHKRTMVIKLKYLSAFVLVLILLLYAFGIFGNIRSDSENAAKDITDSSFILRVGQATEEFKNSPVPDPFFWAYLYASTPIANLQYMTENIEPSNNLTLFITQTVFPDFIGKRVEEKIGRTVQQDQRRSPVFNVSTMFISSFKTLGFLGMLLTYFYFIFFVFLYSYMMKHMHTTKIIGIAILCTIAIFNMFDNMLVFSGLSFQLVYPILFWIYKKL